MVVWNAIWSIVASWAEAGGAAWLLGRSVVAMVKLFPQSSALLREDSCAVPLLVSGSAEFSIIQSDSCMCWCLGWKIETGHQTSHMCPLRLLVPAMLLHDSLA